MKVRTHRWKRAAEFFHDILYDSTVEQLRFIGSYRSPFVERLYWIIAVILCLIYSCYLIHEQFLRFKESPVIVSFRPQEISVQRIPFPAITLCNVNMFKRSVLNELFDDLLAQSHVSKDPWRDPELFTRHYALEQLMQYCLTTPSFRRKTFDAICDINGRDDFVDRLQQFYLTINDSLAASFSDHMSSAIDRTILAYRKAITSCDEMILSCVLSGTHIPCNEIFFPLETSHGQCCSFNMMPKFLLQNMTETEKMSSATQLQMPDNVIKDWKSFSLDRLVRGSHGSDTESKYPKYPDGGGKLNGLSILLNPKISEYSTCATSDATGFTLDAHSSLSIPRIKEYGAAIPPNAEVFVEIDAMVTDSDFRTMKDIKLAARECYLPSDVKKLSYFNIYTRENCLQECLAMHTFNLCGCIPYHMPRHPDQQPCGAKSYKCAQDGIYELRIALGQNNNCSDCRPACTEIRYKKSVTDFKIQNGAEEVFGDLGSNNVAITGSNVSIVHIYFGMNSLYIMERQSLYNLGELIADAGGLFGFTLSVSIATFMELLYFPTLRLLYYIRYKWKRPGISSVEVNRESQSDILPHRFAKRKSKPSIKTKAARRRATQVAKLYPYLK